MPINAGYTELKIFSWFVRRTGLCIQDGLTSKQVRFCSLIRRSLHRVGFGLTRHLYVRTTLTLKLPIH